MSELSLQEIKNELSRLVPRDLSTYDIFLFGAGNIGYLVLPFLSKYVDVKALIDNSEQKRSYSEAGAIPVIGIDDVKDYSNHPLILISVKDFDVYNAIASQLRQYQYPYCSVNAYVFFTNFCEIERVSRDCFVDYQSKDIYLTCILNQITPDFTSISSKYEGNHYFALPIFNKISSDTIFVDCGAYVGDTLEDFLNRSEGAFKQYIAFEPSQAQFEALTFRKQRLVAENAIGPERIILEQKGVGKMTGTMILQKNPNQRRGDTVRSSGTGDAVQVTSLDEYFVGTNNKITCIKADIEGSELEMLQGASGIIQRDHPRLAICIYHAPQDLFTIPTYLKQLVPEYCMAVRHHSVGDTETVLYCWIEEKQALRLAYQYS